MNKSLKLRYVNQLVGGLVIVVTLLLVALVFLVAQRQDLFVSTYELKSRLPESKLDGLQPGTEIILLGRVIGTLRSIEYAPADGDDHEDLLLRMRIREDREWPIYTGSVAHIRRHLAGAGEAFLEIVRGQRQNEILREGSFLPIIAEPAAGDRLEQVANMMGEIREDFAQVRDAMVPAFLQFNQTSRELAETNRDLHAAVRDMQAVTPQLGPLTEQARQVLTISQEAVTNLRNETRQLPGTVDKLQGSLDNAEDILSAARQHWLLRRYIDNEAHSQTISPAEVGRGEIWP